MTIFCFRELGIVQDTEIVLKFIFECAKDLSNVVRNTLVTKEKKINAFGEEQLSVDVICDKYLFEKAESYKIFKAAASEEATKLKELSSCGKFIVCWDPLDGSSIVDSNFAVGTIFSVYAVGDDLKWKGDETLHGVCGRQQVVSAMALYGPRTTLYFTAKNGAHEATLIDDRWELTASNIKIADNGTMFAPANLRASVDLHEYRNAINYFIDNRYTLRYTGGLVPDTAQILAKKKGIFSNPVSVKAPAKLRLVFEVAPIALLIEEGGGKTNSFTGGSTLDEKITHMEHRIPFVCGSAAEVDQFMAHFK